MPIKFHCEHCDQKLSVSSSKVGRKAKCPKCKQPVVVPAESTREDPKRTAETEEGEENTFSEFAVYDDSEWIYETDEPEARARPEQAVDHNRLAIPRSVLYVQGVLLGVVALASFALGVLAGGSGSTNTKEDTGPQPVVIAGQVEYLADNSPIPDDGAVVIAVPHGAKMETKAPIEGIRPDDSPPAEDHPALRAIRELGGDYARADAEGMYKLRLPDRGKYFVLVISRHTDRSNSEQINRTDLAQIGRFFLPAPDLLAQRRYVWQETRITRDRKIDQIFE